MHNSFINLAFLQKNPYIKQKKNHSHIYEAQFKPNITDQSKLVNALHLSAVKRSDKVGCHSAKAVHSKLSSLRSIAVPF